MPIHIAIPVYERPEVTIPVINWTNNLRLHFEEKIEIHLYGNELIYFELSEALGITFDWVANNPLGSKFNFALTQTLQHIHKSSNPKLEENAIVLLGSDDFLTEGNIRTYFQFLKARITFAAFKRAYVVDLKTMYGKMVSESGQNFVGSGFYYGALALHRFIIDKGLIYPERDNSLDGPAQAHIRTKNHILDLHGHIIITKGKQNIWSYDQIRSAGSMASERHLLNHPFTSDIPVSGPLFRFLKDLHDNEFKELIE